MKIYLSIISHPETEETFEVPIGLKSEINVLVLIHLVFFIIHSAIGWLGFPEGSLQNGTVGDLIRSILAISGSVPDPQNAGWRGVLTYQFVHLNGMVLLLSMSVLWMFGHILKNMVGERKVILLYLMCITLSAIAFVISHVVFEIFSGQGSIMEGAFAGALGVMTTTLIFFKSYQFRIFKKLFVPLWQIYTVLLLVSLSLIIEPSIAYALMYLCSITIGGQYAISKLRP